MHRDQLTFISRVICVSQKDEILLAVNSIVFRAKVLVEKMGLSVGIFLDEKDNTPPYIFFMRHCIRRYAAGPDHSKRDKNEGPHLWDPSNLTNQQPY